MCFLKVKCNYMHYLDADNLLSLIEKDMTSCIPVSHFASQFRKMLYLYLAAAAANLINGVSTLDLKYF